MYTNVCGCLLKYFYNSKGGNKVFIFRDWVNYYDRSRVRNTPQQNACFHPMNKATELTAKFELKTKEAIKVVKVMMGRCTWQWCHWVNSEWQFHFTNEGAKLRLSQESRSWLYFSEGKHDISRNKWEVPWPYRVKIGT